MTNKEPERLWWDSFRGIIFAHAKVFHAVERDLQEHSGISLAFIDVLGRLYDSPNQQLRMQELQQESLFTHGGMTRLVDRIEAAGYVRRESVPGDRRGVFVVLTPEGQEIYQSAIEKHQADVEREFSPRLTARQHRAVADALWGFWHDEPPPSGPRGA